MDNEKSFAERILHLESCAEHGDPESLAALYSAMHKKRILSTNELEVMVGSNKNREENLEHHNTGAASVLAFGDALATEIEEGQRPSPRSINYLRWNISQETIRAEAIRATFNVMKSEVSSTKTADFEFMQSLMDHSDNMERYWQVPKRLEKDDPKSASEIQKGITSICHTCQHHGVEMPPSFQAFLTAVPHADFAKQVIPVS